MDSKAEMSDRMPSGSWYAGPGPDTDVVLSSRVRFARNLANFVFPEHLGREDADRLQSLVFDSFNHMEHPERFQAVLLSDLDPLGQRILTERGIITPDVAADAHAGIVVRTDGRFSCTVNHKDHIRMASFAPGFDLTPVFDCCREIDSGMQESLQFAASAGTGYLTASLCDTGSGMKATVLLHLPSISMDGAVDRVFRALAGEGYSLAGCFGAGTEPGSSLGSFYLLSNSFARPGNEQEQLEFVCDGVRKLIQLERGTAQKLLENRPTVLKDHVFRAVAAVKYSRFMGNREGIDLLSKIKWGINLGFVTGLENSSITALLYRIQNAHLHFVLKAENFHLEKDVISTEARTERLRALVIQEALSHIQLSAGQ